MINHFKTFISYLMLAGAFLMTTACERDGEDSPEEVANVTPVVRPVGVPSGSAVTKNIGPEGGTVISADGQIRIDIPQGALSTSTTVGIEPISNTNIAGIGPAYRLTPHGENFSKPVTITQSWESLADSIGLVETLGMAYQKDDGVWQFVGISEMDKEAKTISFETTHFSDWSMMHRISLAPYKATLETGEKITIKALVFTMEVGDDLLVPLVNKPGPYAKPGYPVGNPAPLPTKYIKSWELTGPGNLTRSTQQTVTYQAPSSVSGSAEATVTLELNSPVSGTFLLLSNITIVGDGWIELSINGSTPVRFPATPVVRMGSRYMLSNPEDEGGGYFLLTWTGKVGSYGYDLSNNGTYFHFLPPSTSYTSRYIAGPNSPIAPSGGSVNITKFENGIVEGTFTVTNVGVGAELKPLASASGRFRAKTYLN